jgi:RTX calcium-binding nonapeptide repeat (4 copies)/FG-GAP-like repeat
MSGSSGISIHPVTRFTSPFLSAADAQNISALLGGTAWNGATITYSFPTSSSQYGTGYPDSAAFNGFSQLDSAGHSGQRAEAQRAFSLVASYTLLSFNQIIETNATHATIRLANTSQSVVQTAGAYLPSNGVTGGDIWFGGTGDTPIMGNFDSGQAVLHEIGHALGLKHGQDTRTFGAMNPNRLDIEFSLMNYANYIGSTEGYATSITSPQTFMMYDIAALQYMYGANFNKAGQNVTYSWSPTNGAGFVNGVSMGTPYNGAIFSTIWTAGAIATYDLSNFSQNQVDDMNPGGWMRFSAGQLADLNYYAPLKPSGEIYALGNVYNALLYNGDQRSLITNLITGSGNDTITGNAANNRIDGNGGNDTIDGGGGTDTAVFAGMFAAYTLTTLAANSLRVIGPDGTDTLTNFEWLAFDDQTIMWPPTGAPVAPNPPVPAGPQVYWAASVDVGTHPAGWLPTSARDFNHDGTSDLLWYNSATRNVDLWKLANGKWAGSVDIGTHPAGYQALAGGDFNGDGTGDVFWYNATNGHADIWKIANGQWAGSVSVGLHPTGYQPVASGDFNADGTSDVLWYNPSNGHTDIWQLSNAQWAGSTTIGAHPLGWQLVGAGDFDNDGTSDVLWYNPTTRHLDLWKVVNGQWAGSIDIGAHPAGYAPAGIGDFNNDGTSDVFWFNATTGATDVWLIANGHWSGSSDIGTHPNGWSPAGVGDFNNDGFSDVLWREVATNRIETWLLTYS